MGRLQVALLTAVIAVGAGCSDTEGPNLHGTPFFHATIDGRAWSPRVAAAGCGDYALILQAAPASALIPDADLFEIRISNLSGPGTFSLIDPASSRFAQTLSLQGPAATYQTTRQNPGLVTITGLDLADSLVAGTFSARLTSITPPAAQITIAGSFRLPLTPVYTVQYPEGTPCQSAT